MLQATTCGGVDIRDAAQGESERAGALGERDRVHLVGIELESRRLADRDALAILLLDIGPDGEDANVLEQRFARVDVGALRFRGAPVLVDMDHVDMVIRQDERAGTVRSPLVDADGERALALRQDGGEVAGVRT